MAILVCVVVLASALTLGSASRGVGSGPRGLLSAPGSSPLASALRDAPTIPELDHPGASVLGGVLSTLNLADNQSFPGNASPAIQGGPQVIVYNPKNGELYVRGDLGSAISILDGSTDRVVTTLGVPYSQNAYSLAPNIAVDTSTGVVYAMNFNEGNVTVIDGETNRVTGSIATGGSPASAVFDPSNGDLYVANWGGNNVTVLSCATNSTVANIPVGTHPASILYDTASQRVFVANYGSGNVSVIDASTNAWVANLRTGTTSSYPEDLALDTADNYVDAISELNTNVTIFNAATLAVVGSPHVGSIPEELAYSPIGDAVYVTNGASGNVTVIGQVNSEPLANITTGTDPFGVVYDAVDEEVYVLNSEGQNVTVLDVFTHKATANIDSNAGLDYGVTVDSATGDVFALNEGTYTGSVRGVEANVTVVQDATNLPIASIPLNVFSTGLTYDPGNGKLLVSDVAGEDLYALDPSTGLTAKTAPTGFAWASAYDSATGCVWVLNRGSDNITVLNAGLHSVANLSTGSDPVAIAYDAANGDLYVTDDEAGNVTVY
ncbi:MAG: YncE family protein, partial [Candidatus Acidiferrales bacterium]